MKNLLFITCWIGLAVVFTGCNPQPEAHVLLTQAETLMESRPDSALLLIDSIFYPEKSLKHKQYMQYLVAQVRAKYKTYQDVSSDTLIFEARDYFVKRANKNPSQAALAYFYSGCVYREQNEYEEAMQHYKEANNFAKSATDTLLLGLIHNNMGDLLASEGLYPEALKQYRQAKELYSHFPKKQVHPLASMGRMYLLIQETDSAFLYFQTGLNLARATNDNNLRSLVAQNLSVAYGEAGDYEEAEKHLRESYIFNTDSIEQSRYYLNFAKLYLLKEELDSANFYAQKLESTVKELDSSPLKASIYSFLTQWEKKHANYDKALDYQSKQMVVLKETLEGRNVQSVYKIQQKYDFTQEKNHYNRLLINRQYWVIILLTIVLLAGIVAIILFVKISAQKNRLLRMQETMLVLKETTKDLLHSQSNLQKKEEKQRETLLWKFELLTMATQFRNYINLVDVPYSKKALKLLETIGYDSNKQSQWEMFATTIEELNPGLSAVITKHYPLLSETEFKVCLLSYSGLHAKTIAVVLNQSVHTVNMARTYIRKKMGLTNVGADFCSALKQLYLDQNNS